MQVLTYIGIGLGSIIGLFLLVAAIAPKDITFESEQTVNADSKVVFANIKSFQKFLSWSPWKEKDPGMKYAFSGTDAAKGSVISWEGDKEKGKGQMALLDFTDNQSIDIQVNIIEPFNSESHLKYTLVGDNTQTMVKLAFITTMPFPMNAMALVFWFEKMIKTDYDRGLVLLKEVSEKELVSASF